MKKMKIFGKYSMGLAMLLFAAALVSCSDDDGIDTELVGKEFQGSVVVSGRATADFLYGQVIYRFLSSTEIEIFQQIPEKSGTSTIYGVSGPDTINYVQRGEILDIKIEDDEGEPYPYGYEGKIKPAGLELWAAGELIGLMTRQGRPAIDGTEWQIAGTSVPAALEGVTISFSGNTMNINSSNDMLTDIEYRTVSNIITASFTFNGSNFDNFVALMHLAPVSGVPTYRLYTNIAGKGVTFSLVTE